LIVQPAFQQFFFLLTSLSIPFARQANNFHPKNSFRRTCSARREEKDRNYQFYDRLRYTYNSLLQFCRLWVTSSCRNEGCNHIDPIREEAKKIMGEDNSLNIFKVMSFEKGFGLIKHVATYILYMLVMSTVCQPSYMAPLARNLRLGKGVTERELIAVEEL
jgi:hypothetical protein